MPPDYLACGAPKRLDPPDPSLGKTAVWSASGPDRNPRTRRNRSLRKPDGRAGVQGRAAVEHEVRWHGVQLRPQPPLGFGQNVQARFKRHRHLWNHNTAFRAPLHHWRANPPSPTAASQESLLRRSSSAGPWSFWPTESKRQHPRRSLLAGSGRIAREQYANVEEPKMAQTIPHHPKSSSA